MFSLLKRIVLRPIPHLFSDKAGTALLRTVTKGLGKQLTDKLTVDFLGLLLRGMGLCFHLNKQYRRNIVGFDGRYLFTTADGKVTASATFGGKNMKYQAKAISDWQIKVTFKDTEAILVFLFSKDQDILNSLLKNEVEVRGNLNLLYKFGFMARDLVHRLQFDIVVRDLAHNLGAA
ncbi:MAG: hypothetical protein OEV49_15050 [candidate division Zixibacteria bacterium]|nr:hypothetical protein [candidate division Zixibacteria bacterium]MDH3938779.1 hypothetical protein [candidate division Zixibacteria bacterium]MDH4032934.1 hypothetical protein [candidate division Zixibacteria bacterium]